MCAWVSAQCTADSRAREQALLDAGVVGLKAFMSPSGINDFELSAPKDLAAAMPSLAARGRLPLMVHAELPPEEPPAVPGAESRSFLICLQPVSAGLPPPSCAAGADPRVYATYMNTRPRNWEEDAIRALIGIANEVTPIHIAHLADADRHAQHFFAHLRSAVNVYAFPSAAQLASDPRRQGKRQGADGRDLPSLPDVCG